MNRHSQQGSALLIVLGFLSFMVVSAVAFAVWMRTERLPSSALRRSVANRYLVKAALAQAMSRVDDAIRSHPYPGIWCTNQQTKAYCDIRSCAYDWWESRVFMPPDPEGKGTTSGDPNSRYAPVSKTVSVLNLEALGYLPPGIVNDVRLLARSSWAAQWDYFNFDAGRYAFCAVNVSDMLDINKMAADRPRTSTAAVSSPGNVPPPSRFSLAHLFRQSDDNLSSGFQGMDTFETGVYKGQDSQMPLVSLLDYNLSIGKNQAGNFYSPFGLLIHRVNPYATFYREGTDQYSDDVKGADRQPFVTDSWHPAPTNDLMRVVDISQKPPFSPDLLKREYPSAGDVIEESYKGVHRDFWEEMNSPDGADGSHALSVLDRLTLYDYLDENNVPTSLAMPCAERVPMLTALAPQVPVKVEFVPPGTDPDDVQNEGTTRKKYYDIKIKITLDGTLFLRSTLVFPFSDGRPSEGGFPVQAFARLVFVGGEDLTDDAVKSRNDGFATNFRPLSQTEWTDVEAAKDAKQCMLEKGTTEGFLEHEETPKCLLVTLPSAGDKTFTPKQTAENVDQCWESLDLNLQGINSLERTIVRKIVHYEVTPASADGTIPEKEVETKTTYVVDDQCFLPFNVEGSADQTLLAKKDMEEADFDAAFAKYTIRPCLVTWARVIDCKDSTKTVDIVPASFEDDKAFNGIDNVDVMGIPVMKAYGNKAPLSRGSSPELPIMRFPGTLSFTYVNARKVEPPTTGADNTWVVKSCYAVDPRYNWAPENWWFDTSDDNPTGQKWYDAVFGDNPEDDNSILNMLVKNEFGDDYDRGDRANDPFLFVSNLGYLQSVGELAFLPHLSDLNGSENGTPRPVLGDRVHSVGSDPVGDRYDGIPRMRADFNDPEKEKTMPCALAAWKSYQNYRTNPKANTFEFGANLYRRGIVNGSQGFYVNPYTQSEEVMLAALANSPLNYWVAGKNYNWESKTLFDKNLAFDASTVFRDGGAPVELRGEDVRRIARFLMRRFEDLASMVEFVSQPTAEDVYVCQKIWEDMFDALDWSGRLGCTVRDVYEDLAKYYNNDGAGHENYMEQWKNKNGYSALNRFVFGKDEGTRSRVTLHVDRAIHKDDGDLDSMADPLRGEFKKGDATSCWKTFRDGGLRDIDRMFLHSYWRDCFANRQQLFLIFVRAESTALGGAGEGTPAQQGGRAVALVWRDPLPVYDPTKPEGTANDVYEEDENGQFQNFRHPHKMRILFYHQLD